MMMLMDKIKNLNLKSIKYWRIKLIKKLKKNTTLKNEIEEKNKREREKQKTREKNKTQKEITQVNLLPKLWDRVNLKKQLKNYKA